ncbi:sialomucin core protein 24 isoform 2-T2 [Phoenicopterus ruber ruber]
MGRIPELPLTALCLACLCGLAVGAAQSRWVPAADNDPATVGICETLSDCHSCIGNDTNVMGCKWIRCEKNMCVNGTEVTLKYDNCTVEEQCSSNITNVTTHAPLPTTAITSVITTTSIPGTNATVTPAPSSRKSTFDAASFIGGIVLVLGLQAVFFFLYKFCKSKDRNYHTL